MLEYWACSLILMIKIESFKPSAVFCTLTWLLIKISRASGFLSASVPFPKIVIGGCTVNVYCLSYSELAGSCKDFTWTRYQHRRGNSPAKEEVFLLGSECGCTRSRAVELAVCSGEFFFVFYHVACIFLSKNFPFPR